ncbi:L,D-transpeptidase family protein [Acidimicrobiia bacterium EGI L10123]|uniref:L,D-transpeptidase family protein n=1 Tax=Salinilacustrithrix flava TaxID=2957203 RepID=UPI003D7C16C2|nr:L,D-transpeptidase family protein [Acidimicrobiia bacterium EGI L10123]
MAKPRSPHRRPGARAALLLAIGVALGFSGYHALRSLDVADTEATAVDGGAPTTTVPVTAPPTTEAPTTTTTVAPTTTAPATTAPTTTAPTTTTTTSPPATVPAPPTYRSGDEGPEVAALQERLLALGFWVPVVDGDYGSVTQQAVMAFQKHAGLSRDGIAGPATMAALDTAGPVAAREGGDHVELDLERQLLIVVRGGRTLAFNTSTGTTGWRTPPGRFTVQREIDGVREAPLGDLYRPKYFNAGIAVHGSPSIPGHPASHGCARVHDRVMDLLWAEGLMPVGTPVWVY